MNTNFNPRNNGERKTVDYNFWLQNDHLRSWPALSLLIVSICNFVFSGIFALGFQRYHSTILMPAIEQVNCEIPGSFMLATYSIFLVLSTGTICLAVFLFSLLYKITFLVATLICPVRLTNTRRNWLGFPSNSFDHYAN